ncbi:uncharacterized protein LOC133711269 [Rosa rugosa]|uniref:uncharacterized protein LOC133711269 n=1 Tax=Rosa rugosa TaxID=74645 RepID=UPI002B411862|nr:uncharacterized protein LOC133711269 [Rosa rugosa]
MGKKRKLGQREAAQSQVAEPIVISVDDAGKPLEPLKEIGLIQANVLSNPNEVAVNAAEHPGENPPVPEIEGKSEAVEPRKKKKKKKHKPIDTCVDVAGKPLEPLKEVGLMQANPAELPPTNPTIEAKSGAELSSNPVPEIEAKPAELPPLNTVTKDGVISEEQRMNPDPNVEAKTGTEEVTVKKKKKKKKQKLMESQSTVTTCVDNVEKNGEAKIDEEDVPLKMKKKKNKNQKLGEMPGTVITCVDDVEKNGEAKIDEEDVPLKKKKNKNKKQKLGEMPGTVITCVDNVEKNGEAKIDEEDVPLKKKKKKNKKQKLGEMPGTVITCVDDVEKNGEAKIDEEDVPLKKKKNKNKKQKLGEMPGTVITCVDNVEKNGEAKIDEEDVPLKKKKKKNKKQKLGEMPGTVITCVDDVEKNGEAKIDEEDVPLKKKKKKNKKQKLGEMPGTVITCVDDVEKNGEARVDGQLRKAGPVVTEVKGAEGTVTACVNAEGKISEGGEVAEQVTMPGLIQAVGVVENKKSKKRKRKGNKEMESTSIACVNAGKNVELLPNPLPNVEAKPGEVTPNADVEGECKKGKRKKKDKRKGAEEKPIKQHVEVCVICRGKGHIISTCPLLSNTTQKSNKISGNKLSECPQPLQDEEMKSGEAEKLLVCPPDDTLMQDKSSDRKEGESIVKNGEEEKFIGCPPVDALMKEETSGGKEDESTVKNAEESSCTPEDIFMKDEKSDDKEDETFVKVDSASHPEESYVKPMIEQGPEVVYPVA